MKDCKNILYIGADINAQSSLRKLRKFTTIAASKGYRVAAVWPGFSWQSTEDKWRINFFRVFQKHDACAVVFDGEFMKEIETAEELCTLFNEKGIPVIALDVELPGAVSVRFDEEAAVEELVRHVMSVHKRRNLLFFGDSCQAVSSDRAADAFIRCLKEAGIEDAENRVSYAPFRYGYGVAPVAAKLAVFQPDAVICSDNNIANVAVSILQNMGKSVPDDVIVTGLNGVSKYKSGIPNLTTARRNITLQAQHCFSVIEQVLKADSEETSNVIMPEEMVYSESCGCNTYEMIADTDELIRSLIVQREWACMQERRQGRLYERVMQSSTVEERKEIFRDCLPEMTYLCLRKDFLDNPTTNIGELSPGEDFVVFAASDPNMEGKMFNSEEFDVRLEKQLRNAAPLIIYPVFAKRQYFGFVVSEAPGFVELQMMMGRFLLEMCRSLSILVSREELKIRSEELEDMNEYLNNVKYIDSFTGLLNHNGLIMELENCKAECISSRKTIYTICVDLDHLGNINDVYGHSEGDYAIMQLSKIIKESSSPANLLAHIGSDEFIVVLREDESSKDEVEYFINRVKNKVASFNKESDKEYTLNVNVSTSITVPYEDTDLGKIIDEALLNKRLVKNNRKASNSESVEMTPEELKQVEVIKDVIDNNRFRYAFQPIVNAKTGDIFGYEALMRTDLEHSISPLTIIKYSTANERLYDIERATFFNILDTVSANRDKVEGKKIFINSIPGYQLDAADFDQLRKKYSDILKEVFIEVTEQSEQNDEEVRVLTERSVKDGFGIAIDDYGVGYANTTSLLRYTPNCIKIDRLLIQDLQNDPRKQHFVKNIIEFAHNNNCYALAEGVETSGELKASINLGVDLIQGFYTAKPSFEIADHIEELIQKEILECNASPAEKRFSKLYVVSKEKELMLTRIGLEMYTDILISGQEVVLSGNLDYPAQVKIRIKDNTDSTLTIRNTILDNEKDEVGIEIGENATLTLIVEGDNYINSNGIRVPASSTLKLQGNGNLSIKTKCQEAFGIGNDLQHPFGTILSDISGNLSIDLNGEKAVGIGGCVPGQGVKILLKGGDNSIKASSTAFVGIGAFSGQVNVLLTEMHMAINYNVINGVGIGSPSGTSNIRVSNLLLEIKAGGKSVTGIGGGPGTQNNIEIASAEVILNMNAPRVIMIGCAMGHSKIYAEHTRLELQGSGGHIMGMGSADMGSEIVLKSVGVEIKISSDDPMPIGAKPENCDFGASEPEIQIINYSAEGGEH